MLVQIHADHDNGTLVVFDVENEKELRTPGAVLKDVSFIEDSEGCILEGDLVETVGRGYTPRNKIMFRSGQWTRRGRVLDRDTRSVVRSTPAAIVNSKNIYYLGA